MTRSKRSQRRVDVSARRQVAAMLIGLALIWSVTAILMWRSNSGDSIPTRYLAQLRRLEAANAQADAEQAFKIGDTRLFMIDRADIGQKVPGVPNAADRARFDVRVIPMPFDSPADDEQRRLGHAAFDYAFKYNVALLKLLAETPLQSRPTTTQASTTSSAFSNSPATQRVSPIPGRDGIDH